MRWWSGLLVLCAGCADEPAPLPAAGAALAEGVRLQGPGLALRIGRVTFGGLGIEALSALSATARAEPAGAPAESLDLEADHLTFEGEGSSRRTVLTGNVRLRRGALELRCARLETTSDAAGALVEARAIGAVRVVRAALSAEAAGARIDLARGQVVLEGPVRIVHGEATLEGARAVVSLRDGRVTIDRARARIRLPAGVLP